MVRILTDRMDGSGRGRADQIGEIFDVFCHNNPVISKFLKNLLGSGSDERGTDSAAKIVSKESYKGFLIEAAPEQDAQGWRISGYIHKTVDGEAKTHRFLRADSCSDLESASAMTVQKAKRLIDERGDRLF